MEQTRTKRTLNNSNSEKTLVFNPIWGIMGLGQFCLGDQKEKGNPMLIPTISFEIHDFQNSISEQFLVNRTPENLEKILSHHFTRNIHFTKTFSFQFEKEMRIPVEMIDFRIWMAIVSQNPELTTIEFENS